MKKRSSRVLAESRPSTPPSEGECKFEIRALAGRDEAEIFIYGTIGDSWDDESVTAARFVRDLQNIDAKTLNVRINSIGGSVRDGLSIFNALQRHPATVNVHVDGVALSSASLIAMAGKTVYMADNALMMVHAPWAAIMGNAQEMRKVADMLDKFAAGMATSYASKTGKKSDEMLALLTDGEDHWYTAAEAVDAGFADEITAAIEAKGQFDLSRFRSLPAAAAAFSRRSNEMTPEELAAKAAADKAAAQKAAAEQAAAEQAAAAQAAAAAAAKAALTVVPGSGRTKQQNEEILAAFKPFLEQDGVRAVYDAVLLDPAITVEASRKQLLDHIGKGTEPANPRGTGAHVEMGDAERDKFVTAAAEAIIVRGGSPAATKEVRARVVAGNQFRHHSLIEMAKACLERAGKNVRGMSAHDVFAAITQTTSDFSVLLENVLNKTLQAAYATTPDTWSRFCAVGSVNDFRASNRYRLGSFGNLMTVNEAGEFKYIAIPDGEKASITAATKGALINLSRQAMINDDLGAFTGLAAGLGRAARRTIEVDVYALLAQNSGLGPTMSDSHPLFDAAHGNISATGAISVTVMDDVRVKMKSQKDVSGNDYLDLAPDVWLVPAGSGGNARVINEAQYDTEVSSKFQVPNRVRGIVRDIVDTARLSGTRFYVFADKNVAPVIEVAFLNGSQEPFVEMQAGFEVDGATWKVRHDYGTAVIDYRGAATGAGA